MLATVADHKVMLWSLESGKKTEEVSLKPKGVTSVTFSPDGQWLVVGAADKKIRLWKLNE
jgi:WD40 repeat protein